MEYSESSNDSMETKPNQTPNSRKMSKPWTMTEEIALAKAWVDISKEPETDSSWKRILEKFIKHLGGSDRTVRQVNSKWKNMNEIISKFNAIYNNKLTQREISQSDSDIIKLAQIEYQNLFNNKVFPHEAAWDIVKDHPEWSPVPLMDDDYVQPLKKMKTSESNTYTTSLDEQFPSDFYEEGEGINAEEPQKPQEKGKKVTSSSQEREDQLGKIISEFTEFSNVNKEDVEDKKRHRAKLEEIKAQKLRILEEHLREKRQDKDMEFYLQPHQHLTGAQLIAVLARKREMAKRWGWE